MSFRTLSLVPAAVAAGLSESLKRRGVLGTLSYAANNWLQIASYVRSRAREVGYDRRLGVETKELVALTDLEIEPAKHGRVARSEAGNAYRATPPGMLDAILRDLKLDYGNFTFIDFGSGMGRAVLMASEFPFRKIVGIELSPKLHRIAEENQRKCRTVSRRCDAIELLCMDALEYELPAVHSVIYMFNPFTEVAMRPLLARLQASLERSPREVYIIYGHPVLKEILDAAPFLKRIMASKYYLAAGVVRVEAVVYRSQPIGPGCPVCL